MALLKSGHAARISSSNPSQAHIGSCTNALKTHTSSTYIHLLQSTNYLAFSLASHRALMAQAAHMPNSFSPACISGMPTHAHSLAHIQSYPAAWQ